MGSLQLSTETPLLAQFVLGEESRGHLGFYLAPKIEDE